MATEGRASNRLAGARKQLHIVLALTLLVVGGMASSAQASVLPTQGVYEYCAPADSPDGCVGRLHDIADGGFKVVLNYAVFEASVDQLRRYMDVAAERRIKLIWPMKDTPWWGPAPLASAYGALARSCGGAPDDDALLGCILGLVRGSPATWGYYVADEQPPRDALRVAAFARRLRRLDPAHPRLAVATGEDSVAGLLAPYAAAADVLAADSYPIGTGQPVERVTMVSNAVRRVARTRRRTPAMVLQAFDWSRYPEHDRWPGARWPTAREMRRMRDLAIRAARPSLILWYSYFDVRLAPDPERRWRDLVWAAYGRR